MTAIVLLYDPEADHVLIGEILFGCEEEGVPCRGEPRSGDAEELAILAASTSDLFVGIGVDALGAISVHEQRIGRIMIAGTARTIGSEAARIVLGRPLRSIS